MVKPRALLLFSAVLSASAEGFEDDNGIHLLQLKAQLTKLDVNASVAKTRSREFPGAAERKMCPHELEQAIPPGDVSFGCDGKLKAESTVQCSMWGEPHITATFPSPRDHLKWTGFDVFYIAGLFRMASAADGSWEVQMFNCGAYASAMAARLGKDIIEVIVNSNAELEYYVNGQRTDAGQEVGKIVLESSHRHTLLDWFDPIRVPQNYPGSCIDDPAGQIMIDLVQDMGPKNLNIHLVAQSDAVTTRETDGNAWCNEETGVNGGKRITNWDSQPISIEESLFVSTGPRACEGCERIGWAHWSSGDLSPAKNKCAGLQSGDPDALRLDRVCAAQNPPISLASAEHACEPLRETPGFFADCQLDYCYSGGSNSAAAAAEEEEAVENPQPACFGAGPANCDPASACCNALRDGATLQLDNVIQNTMCNGGGNQEIRFGRAMTQNGVDIDLIVRPVGDYDCGRVTNDKFGRKTDEIGLLSVQAGSEAEFEFNFVRHGTSEPVAPQSLMISLLDIDQGRNNKQQESVTMCGGGGVILTDDSELAVSKSGDCTTVTSTTHGTKLDNPTSVAGMSQTQRARTAAFPVSGASFTAKFGVSEGGYNPRRFLFTGHPTVACVLE